jgi:hypothetical protein
MRYLLALHLPITMFVITLIFGLYPLTVIYFVDCVKRTKEYQRIQKIKPTTKVFETYKGTYCQRSVVKTLHPEAKSYYHGLGYRFYHWLPDAWVQNPRNIVSLKWWRNFFNI